MATGKGTHIGIDIVGKSLEGKGLLKLKNILVLATNIISFVALFWLSYASISFVNVELEFGKEVFFGIHSGILVMIIPIGFSLIGLRFLFSSINYFAPTKAEASHV